MHIPDGYLAPQTTIPALAAMVPVWAVAFKKVKKDLSEKRIPTLALCAAFSFVIMMFNVPVVGGSSAHAVGAVFIAILLGPWAAMISVGAALLIQALVFGDGGIMAFGFNCFNMAVVMPFTGYYIYKLIAGKSKLGTSRNLVGSCIGSYVGINLAAFCASVEFGIQPLLFKAADGTALYCPYPLSVSIPSMMFAHGLIAGPIDAIITTAAIAYIAKYAPQLFTQGQLVLAGKLTAIPQENGKNEILSCCFQQQDKIRGSFNLLLNCCKVSFFKRYKAMLIPLGVLVVLTPLGLIAAGTAWGEWGTDEIKAAVGYIPRGFAAMADKWNALMPDYSLPALGNSTGGSIAGYILSAIVGILLIIGLILLTSVLIKKAQKGKKK